MGDPAGKPGLSHAMASRARKSSKSNSAMKLLGLEEWMRGDRDEGWMVIKSGGDKGPPRIVESAGRSSFTLGPTHSLYWEQYTGS